MTQNPSQSSGPFGLDYQNPESIIVSQRAMRIVIGFLGMALPILLIAFLWVDVSWHSPLHSISHYYYTRAAAVFVIILSMLAVFLLVYKGKDKLDFWLSALAGIFALCVLLFPTNNISEKLPDEINRYSVTILKISPFRVGFHYASAGIFLLSLAGISFFLFTRSNKPPALRGRSKRRRNRIYRTCGVIMFRSRNIR